LVGRNIFLLLLTAALVCAYANTAYPSSSTQAFALVHSPFIWGLVQLHLRDAQVDTSLSSPSYPTFQPLLHLP